MKPYLIIFVFLSGCAFYPKRTSHYQSEEPKEGKAAVYIYRMPTSLDSLNPDVPRFFINEKKLGRLLTGGYYLEIVEPGEIEVSYRNGLFGIAFPWKANAMNFTAKPGQKYFIKFSLQNIVIVRTEFQLVPYDQGETEITTTKLLVN